MRCKLLLPLAFVFLILVANVCPQVAAAPDGAESVEHGRYLAAISSCTECHGDQLQGTPFLDEAPIGYVPAPNLTAGAGGVGGELSEDMPWPAYSAMSAEEVAALWRSNPDLLTANQWSLHAEGTTYFLPVGSYTYAAINFIVDALGEHNGFYVLDDRRLFLPAGLLQEFAKSNDGHLDDDPQNGKAMPLSIFERLAVEQGMILQNLGLACQAIGLSGFPHISMHDAAWFEALGFRMETMPLSDFFFAVPFPSSTFLKLQGQDKTMRYPVGLERDGAVRLKSYAPPYYPSIEAGVHAVVEEEYGRGGRRP